VQQRRSEGSGGGEGGKGGVVELVAVRARLFGAINQKGKTQSGSQAATLWVKPRLGE